MATNYISLLNDWLTIGSPISKQKAYHSRLEGVKKVFIIGVGRSGTHWLCKILSSHPEISGSEEELGRIFGRLLGLVTQNAQPAGQDWDYIIQTYRRLHALCAPRHLVDQSHPLIWYAEAIREVFPDALFIGTHRSALGCVSSMLKHPTVRAWAEKPFDHDLPNPFLGVTRENQDQFESFSLAERCAWRWKCHVERMAELQPILGDRLLLIPYEKFFTDTDNYLNQISSFVGLKESFTPPEVKHESLEKWKQNLCQEDIEKITRIADSVEKLPSM